MSIKVNRNILIAVDDSQNAQRAVTYVGRLLGGIRGFKVTVLHVIPEPEEDYFPKKLIKINGLRSIVNGLTRCWKNTGVF